ncbi:MAG: acetyl-CoA carboxylase biotin carboxyl carrier protein [Cellvibrionales bacterium]|jgi:acetyl-CoA carboxylase biotin carboxyl carrier protein
MKDETADDIKSLIQVFDESDWKELALEVDDFRIFLSRDPNSAGANWMASSPGLEQHAASNPAAAPPPATVMAEAESSSAAVPVPENCVVVKAPNLGIFYRSPKPGAPAYVELGASVDPETEVCLIEVMKLFTPVHAGLSGVVRHICVEDGEMVEHDQPLFYIEVPG